MVVKESIEKSNFSFHVKVQYISSNIDSKEKINLIIDNKKLESFLKLVSTIFYQIFLFSAK